MEQLYESLANNPQIIIGIVVFILILIVIAIIKKLVKIAITIVIASLLFGTIGGVTIQNKYNISYHNNKITATIQGKEINLDFNKLAGAKIDTKKTDDGMRIIINYKDGKKEEIIVPKFLYYFLKLKAKSVELSLDTGG